MNKKKFLSISAIFAFMIGAGVTYIFVFAKEPGPIPEPLKLKVNKDRIINSIEKDDIRCDGIKNCQNFGKMIAYYYGTDTEAPQNNITDVLSENLISIHKIKDNQKTLVEDLSKRGGKHQTFDLGDEKELNVFYSNLQWAKEKATNRWVKVGKATTTIDAFNQQVQASLWEKIMSVAYAATDTFYPDPDAETYTFDSRNYVDGGTSQTWSSIRAANGTACADAQADNYNPLFETSATTNQYDLLTRAIYLFYTGPTIPSGDIINSATFSLWPLAKRDQLGCQNSANSAIVIVQATTGSNTACTVSDFENMGTVDFGRSGNQASWSTDAYNDIVLNESGVANIAKGNTGGPSGDGRSKFGTKYGFDIDNLEPTSNGCGSWGSLLSDGIDVYFADQTGQSNDPKLVVVHSSPASFYQPARKPKDQSFTSTSFTYDSDLLLTLSPNKEYIIDATIFSVSPHNSPDLKVLLYGDFNHTKLGYLAYDEQGIISTSTSQTIDLAANVTKVFKITGTVKTTNATTTLRLGWAQNNVDPSNPTTIKTGSYLWEQGL